MNSRPADLGHLKVTRVPRGGQPIGAARGRLSAPRPTALFRCMDTHRLGMRFEEAAAVWLAARGWQVIERNVRFKRKEIDLVIRRGDVIAFVEVKGRQGAGYGRPVEAVTWKKRREIESVARWWVERNGAETLSYRFDVIGVLADQRRVLQIEHLEDAWRPTRA